MMSLVQVFIPEEARRSVALLAKASKMSINQYVQSLILAQVKVEQESGRIPTPDPKLSDSTLQAVDPDVPPVDPAVHPADPVEPPVAPAAQTDAPAVPPVIPAPAPARRAIPARLARSRFRARRRY